MREEACGSPSAHWAGDCQSHQVEKNGNKLSVLLVSCYVGELPTESHSAVTLCGLGKKLLLQLFLKIQSISLGLILR